MNDTLTYPDEATRMRFRYVKIMRLDYLAGTNMPLRRDLQIDEDLHFISSWIHSN